MITAFQEVPVSGDKPVEGPSQWSHEGEGKEGSQPAEPGKEGHYALHRLCPLSDLAPGIHEMEGGIQRLGSELRKAPGHLRISTGEELQPAIPIQLTEPSDRRPAEGAATVVEQSVAERGLHGVEKTLGREASQGCRHSPRDRRRRGE